jgi:hypothetical protein
MNSKLQTVDPRTICAAIPSHTGRVDVLTCNGLCNIIGTGRLANQPMFEYNGSNVAAVRNVIAEKFMTQTECDWLMMIDDDIGFTCQDWDYVWEEQGNELAVCAEYLQKIDGQRIVAKLGLGFARVHRSVFMALQELSTADGTPWVHQAYYAGCLLWDYFPQGATSEGTYRQEDHGFWQLVRLAGVAVRVERRTHLEHSGRSSWRYDADQLAQDDADEGAAQ